MSDTDGSNSEVSGPEAENIATGLEPWLYEPPARDEPGQHQLGAAAGPQDDERAGNTNWCLCGCCSCDPGITEFVCCREIEKTQWRKDQLDQLFNVQINCITEHPGFTPLVLNPWVLEGAWMHFRQQYGRRAYEGELHKKYRHVAYRQYVRFIWRFLGFGRRVVIPACVVSKIRKEYPAPDQVYVGFKPPLPPLEN